jgi:3-isopropylmalate/(R)-2-methylmalate dehydratase large subunit
MSARTSMTLAEKIIARAAGRTQVVPGDVVTCGVDLAMVHDSSGPRRVKPLLERLGVDVWDPSRIVVITDHFLPARDDVSRGIQDLTRQWVAEQNITAFHDGIGICHVVLPQQGHLKPGMLIAGGDSHSPTGGAFGAYMFGVGATDMAGILATGETWLDVPETIRIEWHGGFGSMVCAKDVMLFLCGQLGLDGGRYQAVEYCGSAVGALGMQERMTLSNMTAELGAQAGLIAPDETTTGFLQACGVDVGSLDTWQTDADAAVAEDYVFDAAALSPQVAAPHSPANAAPVEDHAGTAVDSAYIGACTGAKYADLEAAAAVLAGHNLAPGVDLLVAPASQLDMERAAATGIMQVFEEAGARILPTSCGMCAGYGPDRLAENKTCISSTARNFKGRMGAASSRVFLASPFTVAAAAIAGHIVDPRHIDRRSP